jgi:uncharacterized membrane protein
LLTDGSVAVEFYLSISGEVLFLCPFSRDAADYYSSKFITYNFFVTIFKYFVTQLAIKIVIVMKEDILWPMMALWGY